MIHVRGFLTFLSVLIVCGTAFSDNLLVMRESYGDETAKEIRYWFSDQKAARIDEKGSMISRMDEGKTYILDHTARTYLVWPHTTEASPESIGKAKVTPTGDTRKIGKWNARKSIMEIPFDGAVMKVEIWTSTEVDFDQTSYRRMIRSTAEHLKMDWMNAFLELEGFPVLQISSFGPIQTRQELISAETKSAPAGTYSPPSGYTRK